MGDLVKTSAGEKVVVGKPSTQKGLPRPLTFLYARTESPDMVFTRDGDHLGSLHQANADRSRVETACGAKKQPGAAGEIHPQ